MSAVVYASRVFPWLKYLSAEQIEEFYADFFSALERTLQTKDWSTLEQTIERWQATAEVLADSELSAILTMPSIPSDLEEWDDVESELFGPSA